MGMMKEFKEFAMRGNVIDLAVAVVIGGAEDRDAGAIAEGVGHRRLGIAGHGGSDGSYWDVTAIAL